MIVANIELRPNKFNDLKTNATFKKQISSGKVILKETTTKKRPKTTNKWIFLEKSWCSEIFPNKKFSANENNSKYL